MIIPFLGIGLPSAMLILSGCGSPAPSTESQRQIGYAFYSSLDSMGDSSFRRDAVSHSLLELIGRAVPETDFKLVLERLPSADFQKEICMAPDPYWMDSRMLLLTGIEETSRLHTGKTDSFPLLNHPWVSRQSFPSYLGEDSLPPPPIDKQPRLKLNMLLAKDAEPLGADDGAFNIWISEEVPGTPGAYSAIRIYGDSSLYERCLAFRNSLAPNPFRMTYATSHTYSNLHDHQLWFFPDPEASDGIHAQELLEPLFTGIQQTHQPVKIRLVLTGIDACHQDFLMSLIGLQLTAEADLKVILADSDKVSTQAALRLNKLKTGTCRLWAGGDSLHPLPLASRFLLVDGPYVERENEPAAPARLCFFLGDDLIQSQQRKQVAIWTRVDNKRVFTLAEQHWNRLWEMSDSLDFAQPHSFKRAPNCRSTKPKTKLEITH